MPARSGAPSGTRPGFASSCAVAACGRDRIRRLAERMAYGGPVTRRRRWRRRPAVGDATVLSLPLFPDCWLAPEDGRELRCWGAVDTDPDVVIDIWLWFTGTEAAADLEDDERRGLRVATTLRPLPDAPDDAQARLLRRIGSKRLSSEHDRWGLWSVPVDHLEGVLAAALTRRARAGRLRSPIVA